MSSLCRLLQSFQSKLEEITIVALPEDMHNGQAGKAVQLHSYWDPTKRETFHAFPTIAALKSRTALQCYSKHRDMYFLYLALT